LESFKYFQTLEDYIRPYHSDLSVIHPFPPAELPNPFRNLPAEGKKLKEDCDEDIRGKVTLGFLDAGALLNLPYFPL
jgi:cytosolic phospholipase A2